MTRVGLALLALFPAIALAIGFFLQGPGPNPVEEVTHLTGEWALRFVLLSLAITPLRKFFGWPVLAPYRRTLGLIGFGYALAHFLVWVVFDFGLDPSAIVDDLFERPFIAAGMAAFVLLAILAGTSTRGAMRRLGTSWIRVHQLVYLAALLAVIHHFWLIKADYRPAIVHAALLVAVVAPRIYWLTRKRHT